jgi:hypothetical protein
MAHRYGNNSDRADEFHEKLRALIGEYQDVLGPRDCPDDEEHDCEESPPSTNAMLSTYILATQWDDLLSSEGVGHTDYVTAPGSSFPQILGLSLITYKELETLV